jgi:hypothetical protein
MPQALDGSDLQDSLATRGYAVVTLMTPGEAAEYRGEVAELAEGGFARTDSANRGFEFHSSFLADDLGYRYAVHQHIKPHFDALIAPYLPGYEVLISGLFLKKPGTGPLPLHFDWTMVADLETRSMNVWCPLVDVTAQNGTLHVVEGSQRFVPHISAPDTPPWFSSVSDALTKAAKSISLKAGQALIYDSTLLHLSSANQSPTDRFVIALNCLPRGVHPVIYRLDKGPETRFEVYDMSGDRFFQHRASHFYQDRFDAPSLGFVPNPNRMVGLDEVRPLLGDQPFEEPVRDGGWKRLWRALR